MFWHSRGRAPRLGCATASCRFRPCKETRCRPCRLDLGRPAASCVATARRFPACRPPTPWCRGLRAFRLLQARSKDRCRRGRAQSSVCEALEIGTADCRGTTPMDCPAVCRSCGQTWHRVPQARAPRLPGRSPSAWGRRGGWPGSRCPATRRRTARRSPRCAPSPSHCRRSRGCAGCIRRCARRSAHPARQPPPACPSSRLTLSACRCARRPPPPASGSPGPHVFRT